MITNAEGIVQVPPRCDRRSRSQAIAQFPIQKEGDRHIIPSSKKCNHLGLVAF
ncbi:MAG: hypothetical protein AB4352_02200 [Hormoscilla sp.]